MREWKAEEADLIEQIKDHSIADKDFLLTSNHILDLANRAYSLFLSSNAHQKRQILNLLFTNFSATAEKLMYKIKEPLGAVLFAGENQKWLSLADDLRTKYWQEIREFGKCIKEYEKLQVA